MKKFFITFGGPYQNYHEAVERLCKQAKEFNVFDEIIGYTEKDLQNDEEFWGKHKDFISKNPRGYGYWLWKPYLILKKLKEMNEGDSLLFLDCGCELNINGKERFLTFFEKIKNKLIMGTGTCGSSNDLNYTKNDLTKFCGMENDIKLGMDHMQPGQILLIKCDIIVKLYTEYYEIGSNNYNLIDDSPSITPNYHKFIEHRHDQSVLSLLTKKYNLINYDLDPTYFGINSESYNTKGKFFPIWTCRNKSGISVNNIIDKIPISEITSKECYFLSHLGLGDNISMIGAVRYLSIYYEKIKVIVKEHNYNNLSQIYQDCKKIEFIVIKAEFNDLYPLITNMSPEIDLFACGFVHNYKNVIRNNFLNNYKTDNNQFKNIKNYSVFKYPFIIDFYTRINLSFDIYKDYFYIPEIDVSKKLYENIKHYKIVFVHTKSSTNEITIDLQQFVDNQEYLIVCCNKNYYDITHPKYEITNSFINLPIINYITIIKNADDIYVIDSCFACIICAYEYGNILKTTNVNILSR